VDLNGTRTLHGPVTPVLSNGPLPDREQSQLLKGLGQRVEEEYRRY
jgi:hypothetical protein